MFLVAGANVVRLAPSLLIEDRDIDEAVPKLKAALEEWLAR